MSNLILLALMQVKEDESSTEESDRSFTPQQSAHGKHKSKGRSPMGPPSWIPGFPPVPPPGLNFQKVNIKNRSVVIID